MTEPVPRAHARRTVRMASALIAVQVALCAVIGFVTFGSSHHGQHTSTQADSLANAPRLIPPAPAAPPAPPDADSPATGASSTKRTTAKGGTVRTSRPPPVPPSPPSRSATSPATGSAPEPPTTEATQTLQPLLPTPIPSIPAGRPGPTPSVQTGVVVLDICSPLGALGVTRDGTRVLCRVWSDGKLRWQTV